MASSFQNIVSNFAFMALILLSIFSIIAFTQHENNAPNQLVDNSFFGGANGSYTKLTEQIDSQSAVNDQQYGAFQNETPVPSIFSIVLFKIVSVGKAFSAFTMGLYTVFVKLPIEQLGIPDQVLTIISAVLIITLVITGWILYKIGG